MGFSVNTNLDALSTYKNLNMTQNSLSKSLERLSSGLRINQAGDDAAGLTIATKLGAQVSGLTQASRNAQDGTSVVQTADGALDQAQSLLQRLRDLAVQAANDSNSTQARSAITTEATSISAELARIGSSVNFNGQNLLDGSVSSMKFQVGADGNAASQISVDLTGANLSTISTNLSTTTAGQQFAAAQFASLTGSMTFTSTLASGGSTATTAALGTTGFTSSTSASTVASTLNANAAFQGSFKANVSTDGLSVIVTALDAGTVSAKDSSGTAITSTSAATTGNIQFNSAVNAQAAITTIDGAITSIANARANIGALENRFASASATLSTSIQNLTSAKSRITDVDMASEMVNYSRANILSQSGTAMLAQANSLPQLALKLLG